MHEFIQNYQASPLDLPVQPQTPADIDLTSWNTDLKNSEVAAADAIERAKQSQEAFLSESRAINERTGLTGPAWEAELAAVRQRYGDPFEAEDQAKKIYWRRRSQEVMASSGIALIYADEVGPRVLENYFPSYDTLGSEFSLPDTQTPTREPEEVVKQLNTLPFVKPNHIQGRGAGHSQPELMLRGSDFPINRIISADTFAAWSGRGTYRQGLSAGTYIQEPNGAGDKGFIDEGNTFPQTSAGAIAAYAGKEVDQSDAKITVVKDLLGEYWGVVTDDGSHRIATAKLRGQARVPVGDITIPSEANMPTIPFSVRENFAHLASAQVHNATN